MKKALEKIQKHIEVLNHNSEYLSSGFKELKKDFKQHEDNQDKAFGEFRENDIELKTNVCWLKKIQWFILTTIIISTLISIATGITMMVIGRGL